MSGLRGELIQLGHQLHMAKELQRLERPEDLEALRKCTEIQGFAVDNVAFISVPGEVRELAAHGFEALEAYGRDGMPLPLDVPDRKSSWIYYVARKVGGTSDA